ncbi:MAG: hypothetical protein P1V34_15645 [Alphaproteobacteria bacterium]|nr:hypothetical protein [Alphaproteobacteria bacterium]
MDLFKVQLAAIGRHSGRRFVFDTNINHNYTAGNRSIYDAWSLPRFSFLTDSPLRKLDKLTQFPDLGLVGVVDLDFQELLSEVSKTGRGSIPLPHAGPPVRAHQRRTEERPIDVLIIGNVSSTLSTEEWLQMTSQGDPTLKQCLQKAYERCRTSTHPLWKIMKEEAASAGIPLSDTAKLAKYVNALETQLIADRRRELLKALNTIPAHYHGGGESPPEVGNSVTGHGPITFLDALDLMQKTKVVIDVSPSFRNGAHERVFYAISRGAYVLTEPSRFLEHEVENDFGIGFLPYNSADLESTISNVLDRGSRTLDDVRDRALQHYAKTHTWSCRTEVLLKHLETEFWSH